MPCVLCVFCALCVGVGVVGVACVLCVVCAMCVVYCRTEDFSYEEKSAPTGYSLLRPFAIAEFHFAVHNSELGPKKAAYITRYLRKCEWPYDGKTCIALY